MLSRVRLCVGVRTRLHILFYFYIHSNSLSLYSQVLLVTSYLRDGDIDMNEVMEIRAVQGRLVQFTNTVKWYHHAGSEYQTEVSLLSRQILLRYVTCD